MSKDKDEAVQPKKKRAPRKDFGINSEATIKLTKEAKDKKYRGKRESYFELLKLCNHKSVDDFYAKCPPGDPPRGWLRFFIEDGAATVSGGKKS